MSETREKTLRQAVEVKRKLVDRVLRFSPSLKGVRLYVESYVDLKCKTLDKPGAFVNVSGDYVPYNNSKQRLAVDRVVNKYSDNEIGIYNNIGNRRSSDANSK
jgi:hypothetical protein